MTELEYRKEFAVKTYFIRKERLKRQKIAK